MRIALSVVLALVIGCDKPAEKKKEEALRVVASSPPLASAAVGVPAKLEKFEQPELRIKAKAETTIRVKWTVPPGTAVNDDAPFRVRWNRSDGLADAPPDAKATGSAVKDGYAVKVQPMPGAPNATLSGEMDLVVCDAANHAVCLPVHRQVELGFVVVPDGPTETSIAIPLPAARN